MSDLQPLPPVLTQLLPQSLLRARWVSLLTGAAALLLCAIGWFFTPQAFYRSYLFAWLFFLGISLGSMAWVMIHHLVGGNWGRCIQRIAEAAALNLPLLFILFLPIMFGIHSLYPWADLQRVAHDAVLRHKIPYLNTRAWIVRSCIYFAIWTALALWLAYASRRHDRSPEKSLSLWMRRVSALGLPIYVLSMSMAGVDWVMSREPHYYSTIFGFILVIGHALSAILFLVVILTLVVRLEPLRSFVTVGHYNDLGNLMLTCVILWAYVAFAQYLISWTGNLQEEVKWYYLRSRGVLGFLAAMMILLHFILPFLLLLLRDVKRRPKFLALLAVALLPMRLIDFYWMVVPTGEPVQSLNRFWLNLAAPIGIGGIWLSAFIWRLPRATLLARTDHAELHVQSPADNESHENPTPGNHGEPHVHPA